MYVYIYVGSLDCCSRCTDSCGTGIQIRYRKCDSLDVCLYICGELGLSVLGALIPVVLAYRYGTGVVTL